MNLNKRNNVIDLLAKVGRNPIRLQKLSNEELREVLKIESEKIAELAAQEARTNIQRAQAQAVLAKRMKRRQRQREQQIEWNRQQAAAESFRLKVISSPLPPIPSTISNDRIENTISNDGVRQVKSIITRNKQRIEELKPLLATLGGPEFFAAAQAVRESEETISQMRHQLAELLNS